MEIVILTALGVGGATVFGAIIGFIFKDLSHKFSDIVLSFAAGIMLAASLFGLILPALEYGGKFGAYITVIGIIIGALFLSAIDRFVPHLHKLSGIKEQENSDKKRLSKVLLFVIAIAIHNLPEGIAAGVGFGSGNNAQAFVIAGGIALQNIPEGMVIIGPMLAEGISKKRAFVYALITGLVEVLGTFIGYFAVSISQIVLPYALAFAGGTMLYIISDEIIPETHSHGVERGATYSLLIGFCLMFLFSVLVG